MPRKSLGHFSTQLPAEELKNFHLQVEMVMADLNCISFLELILMMLNYQCNVKANVNYRC